LVRSFGSFVEVWGVVEVVGLRELGCGGVQGIPGIEMSCKSVMGGSSPWAPWLVHTAVAVGAITIAAAANRYWFHARSKGRPRVVGIIPARYKSSRFEGKPLVHIMGKPMIQVLPSLHLLQCHLNFISAHLPAQFSYV
jgi:hypothetical protein